MKTKIHYKIKWLCFKQIMKHKYNVMKECFKCGLFKQGLMHDNSKLGKYEFERICKYYVINLTSQDFERQQKGYSEIWLHHKGCNRHHWEYWIDVDGYNETCVKMPINDVVEMLCDWITNLKYNNSNDDWDGSKVFNMFIKQYNSGKIRLHIDTYNFIFNVLSNYSVGNTLYESIKKFEKKY